MNDLEAKVRLCGYLEKVKMTFIHRHEGRLHGGGSIQSLPWLVDGCHKDGRNIFNSLPQIHTFSHLEVTAWLESLHTASDMEGLLTRKNGYSIAKCLGLWVYLPPEAKWLLEKEWGDRHPTNFRWDIGVVKEYEVVPLGCAGLGPPWSLRTLGNQSRGMIVYGMHVQGAVWLYLQGAAAAGKYLLKWISWVELTRGCHAQWSPPGSGGVVYTSKEGYWLIEKSPNSIQTPGVITRVWESSHLLGLEEHLRGLTWIGNFGSQTSRALNIFV